ncbi:Hypothetical protein FKW44_005972 [Caligus rogercresseyi]|uniref:Uncharacterized protein n=1 Tax=Caligus rogercresseyi TaxID=217165 RepID=A0A7T8KCR0_CALRO|nr:Hypothetical protein FKW44_005972 [Caligus rogercresseyi]
MGESGTHPPNSSFSELSLTAALIGQLHTHMAVLIRGFQGHLQASVALLGLYPIYLSA